MAGHVFVIRGDLRKLGCDAWLMPCGDTARPDRQWIDETPGACDVDWPDPPADWSAGARRVLELRGWRSDLPRPWLVHVGASSSKEIRWFAEGAREFLDRAGESLRGRVPRCRRAKHLLALPLVGTGGGGAKHAAGAVVRELLPVLRGAARSRDADIALVTREEAAFAAAQAERSRWPDETQWTELGPSLFAEAKRLAELAANGQLVLFLGAGVGKSAGLPLWNELLDELAQDAGVSEAERRALADLDPTDRARLIAVRLKGKTLGQAVRERFEAVTHHSISHALLADLPVEAVVTTNYDLLFEEASVAAGIPVRILPRHAAADSRRWVLKMHGSIEEPKDIVVTREDYLRYEDQRRALAGIVQALLITRHMLFVGFGLRDENFHRIVDAVRKAVEPGAESRTRPGPLGTAVALLQNPLHRELWERDLHWIAMQESAGDRDQAAAARRLEIFLDCVVSRTSSARYLLQPSYADMLTTPERTLAEALLRFTSRLDDEAKRAPQWRQVRTLLASLGWDAAGENDHSR
jgi:NAD-dependent SIR2 family protein deacetylase